MSANCPYVKKKLTSCYSYNNCLFNKIKRYDEMIINVGSLKIVS